MLFVPEPQMFSHLHADMTILPKVRQSTCLTLETCSWGCHFFVYRKEKPVFTEVQAKTDGHVLINVLIKFKAL